ncbi:MAG: imidazole glycerol phosphate synthase subunit HisH [Archangiaceae bacterium]|nr:imidazole glycerol phosphate synthase subunit HisH [Archangiaceae bacterium]
MKAALFDFGAGNLHSLVRGLAQLGVDARIETDAKNCIGADLLVLPGVGAFGHAAQRLAPAREAVKQALVNDQPALGICLGMQLFFDSSEEGAGQGVGFIEGQVTRLTGKHVPHIGWTPVEGVPTEMYYAHSYACRPKDPAVVKAWSLHDGERIAAIVRKGRTVGVQFHPEKSSRAGLQLLGTLIREVTS